MNTTMDVFIGSDSFSDSCKSISLQVSQNDLSQFSIDNELRNFFFYFLLRFTTRFLCFRYFISHIGNAS